jgi:hypothetical protein
LKLYADERFQKDIGQSKEEEEEFKGARVMQRIPPQSSRSAGCFTEYRLVSMQVSALFQGVPVEVECVWRNNPRNLFHPTPFDLYQSWQIQRGGGRQSAPPRE